MEKMPQPVIRQMPKPDTAISTKVVLKAHPINMKQASIAVKSLVALRVESLSGKVLLEKDNDMVMRNFVRIMYHLMANYEANNLPSITLTDTGGNARTGPVGPPVAQSYIRAEMSGTTAPTWYSNGAAADATLGILIGTGGTPPARTDYVMQALIPHGGGAGAITYNQQLYASLNDYQFTLTREFTNAGSILSVTEAGMQYGVCINNATAYRFLLLHDVFTAIPVAVGNGVRIIYTWSF